MKPEESSATADLHPEHLLTFSGDMEELSEYLNEWEMGMEDEAMSPTWRGMPHVPQE